MVSCVPVRALEELNRNRNHNLVSSAAQGERPSLSVSGRSRRRIVRGTSTISLLDPFERRGSLFSSPTAHQVDLFEDK